MNAAVDVFVVRYPLAEAVTVADVTSFVEREVPRLDGEGAVALLDAASVYTVSLYATTVDDREHLEWYVEVDRDATGGGAWRDPAAVVRESSPLFDAGLADLVADDPPTVFGPDELPLHETHPRRPSRFEERTDALPVVRSHPADEGTEPLPTPEIAATRLEIRRGLATRFVELLARLMHATDDAGAVEGKFEEWSDPVIEEESMYTESFFLERATDGLYLCYYMEANTVQGVYDAYDDSDSLVARLSDAVMRRIFVRPERMLDDVVGLSDHVALAHATAPERP